MARAMPVLPDVESKMILPGRNFPVRMPSRTIHKAGRSLTDPPGLNPSSLAKMRTFAGSPSVIRWISSSGVSPIRSRTDSTFFGSLAGNGTRRKLVLAVVMTGPSRLSISAGDGWNDGNTIAFLQTGFEVLLETNVVTVYVDVDEAANLAGFVADSLLDAGKMLLQVLHDGFDVITLRRNLIGPLSEFTQWGGYANFYGHRASSLGI